MTIRTFYNLIRNRKCQKALSRFKRTVMTFILVPVLLFDVFVIVNYSTKLKSEYDQRIEAAYKMLCEGTEERFAYIGDTYEEFFENEAVRMFVSGELFDKRETFNKAEDIKDLVRKRCYKYDWFKEICIYSSGNGYIISNIEGGEADRIKPSWYLDYVENKRTDNLYSEGDDIVVTKYLVSTAKKRIGILAMRIDKEEFVKSLGLNEEHPDYAVAFTTRFGDELIKSGEVDVGRTNEYKVQNGEVNIRFDIDNKTYNNMIGTIITYTILCIAISILAAYILSVLCTAFAYDRVTEVLLQFSDEPESSMENVSTHVLEDIDKDKDVDKEIAASLARLHQAQLTALQMQINPHFLFNVLSCVNVLILQKETKTNDAASLISHLSDILRYAMTEPKYSAKIHQELEMAKKYIEIERIEIGEFDCVWNISPDVPDRECIKLFLQPIIENSVMHGIKKLKDRRGRIEVSAKCEGNDTVFTVTDNGDGMTKQKLASIRKGLKEPYDNYSSNHIGMKNVNERIKLVYGKNYGLTVDSDETGTKVTIRIGGGCGVNNTATK